MSKPTDRHKELCKLIQGQASFWADSNDIDSPTHSSDIGESLNQIDWLDTSQYLDLEYILNELHLLIRKIGK